MRKWTTLTVLATVMAFGCSRNITPNDSGPADTGTNDTGSHDTGTHDTSTDTGTTDTGGDTGTNGVDCQADLTGSTPVPIGGPGNDFCVTDTLHCGDVVDGTTEGGSTWYGNDWGTDSNRTWTDKMGCNGSDTFGESLSAPERVYTLDLTNSSQQANLVLYNDCGDLVLRAVRGSDPCPGKAQTTYFCTSATTDGDGHEMNFTPLNTGYNWTIIIDGLNGFQGNYRLEVNCP